MIYIFLLIVVSFVGGMIVTDIWISSFINVEKYEQEINKWKYYFQILNMWLDLKQQGKGVVDYMKEKGYLRIAIYGMSDLGNRLFNELRGTSINVVCVIDKKANILGEFELISPDEEIPSVDLLVVCAEFYFNDIKRNMETKVNCPILSLSGLLGNAFSRNL